MAYTFRPLRAPGVAPQAAPGAISTTLENLLIHIPGEASGFYLLSLEMLRPTDSKETIPLIQLGILFGAALVLLVLVRKLAGSGSVAVATSAIAFGLWMTAFQDGFIRHLLAIEKPGLALVLSAFFSAVVTALANAGKIR